MASTATYLVTGMTCAHCVSAVREEISALGGVVEVEVDLAAGGVSRVQVTSDAPLSDDQVAVALDEAGDYHLTAAGESV
jgi:copper chaperone CopZ